MRPPAPVVRALKSGAARLNLEVTRRDLTHPARRAASMRHHSVDLVIDVGANRGQYVGHLREHGYRGRVVSFEPIPEVLAEMRAALAADAAWEGLPYALGATDGPVEFQVSADTVTSSVLRPASGLLERIPTAAASRTIEVPLRRLQTLWTEVVGDSTRRMLKLDVQGYEHAVLDGLDSRIDEVTLVEVEMSLTSLYEGGASVHDLLPRLHDHGFSVVSIDSGFVDASTGQVLDIDMLMAR